MTGISFVANMAMWGAMFGGGRDDDEHANPIALLATALEKLETPAAKVAPRRGVTRHTIAVIPACAR